MRTLPGKMPNVLKLCAAVVRLPSDEVLAPAAWDSLAGLALAAREEMDVVNALLAERAEGELGLLTDEQRAEFDEQNRLLDEEGETRVSVAEYLSCRLEDMAESLAQVLVAGDE